MHYLRCESEIVLIDNQISCSAWQSVSENELLGALVRSSQLTQADYYILAGGTIAIMLTAIGVRVILKLLLSSPKGDQS